jgi:hypothetical protein
MESVPVALGSYRQVTSRAGVYLYLSPLLAGELAGSR